MANNDWTNRRLKLALEVDNHGGWSQYGDDPNGPMEDDSR